MLLSADVWRFPEQVEARSGQESAFAFSSFLPPIGKYRSFWAGFSIRTGIKTDISKYFPVVTLVFTVVLVPLKSTEALRRKTAMTSLCLSWKEQLHSVTSVQEQLLTAHFSFFPWTLRLLLAHSPAAKHRGSAPLSAVALDQRNRRKTR